MTSTNDIAAAVLTKDDVQALRKCDRAIFTLRDGKTTIRCIKETRNPGPFDPKEREYVIERCDSDVKDYAAGWLHQENSLYECHASTYGGSMNDASPFTTAAALIRPGDHLTLEWMGGNDNDYLRDASLTNDELRLVVRRGGKRLAFWVASTICHASRSRMVQRIAQ